jgi:hypothetical protein
MMRAPIFALFWTLILFGCAKAPATVTRAPLPAPTKVIPTSTAILTSTPLPQVPSGTVLVKGLNIRSGPGTNFGVIGSMKEGETFYILDITTNNANQQWLLIPIKEDTFGWVIGESNYVTQQTAIVSPEDYEFIQDATERAKLITAVTPTTVFVQLPTPESAPTAISQSEPQAVCSCSSNQYNCSDFATHNQAQSCFNYCIATVGYDVHDLDRDSDGSACESNP